MYEEFKRQEFRPVPKGSNPLWLLNKEKISRYKRYSAWIVIVVMFAAGYYVLMDYITEKDPNASECKLGFADTGCPAGYECAGGLMPCVGSNSTFKYAITKIIFSEKKCSAPVIYREVCKLKNSSVQ